MTIFEIAQKELIKKGMKKAEAAEFAKNLFAGFPLYVIQIYSRQQWKEACRLQRNICRNTKKLTKLGNTLELSEVIRFEVENAAEPVFR